MTTRVSSGEGQTRKLLTTLANAKLGMRRRKVATNVATTLKFEKLNIAPID
ncbi:hypothetical protein N646_1909 [Vibrio alginolyticus NBRC 15630 = ATCC 17749]|uniref:Uncharacterized protein n=1 Tax=Vibrio alginolyticus (strain ATCC 17749 / DSM 2171 / NBRC 15630 / NCIMB 1903 / NCTC 12160 / XII-53) TaxID=1219076 RepID=A0A2I3CBS8_VIBAX|nr:hypothetical protein N646_1909 [Vibrio alginolyticus NBRC 15630 = ATCC 17749]